MRLLFAFAFIFFAAGCRPVSENTNNTGNARHLLNKGLYEETISLLTQNTTAESRNAEERILLASAFAGSVGLNLVESYPAFEELFFREALINRTANLADSPQPDAAASNNRDAEKEILGLIDSLMTGGKVIFGLKWIPPEQRARILTAATELDKVPKTDPLYRSAVVYKIIIFSDLFMSTFRDSLGQPSKMFESPTRFFCEVNVALFAENMAKLQVELKLVNSAIEDLVAQGGQNPVSLQKLTNLFGRLRVFFEKNRSAVNLGHLMHGALRNEICQ